jgi:hypothetical protein
MIELLVFVGIAFSGIPLVAYGLVRILERY